MVLPLTDSLSLWLWLFGRLMYRLGQSQRAFSLCRFSPFRTRRWVVNSAGYYKHLGRRLDFQASRPTSHPRRT